MSNQTFIDGVGEVRLTEGVVRMDLLSMSPTRRDEEKNPVPEFVEQLVMSPRAFMRVVAALSQTLKGMEEKGLITRGNGEDTEAATEVATAGKKAKGKGKDAGASPNF